MFISKDNTVYRSSKHRQQIQQRIVEQQNNEIPIKISFKMSMFLNVSFNIVNNAFIKLVISRGKTINDKVFNFVSTLSTELNHEPSLYITNQEFSVPKFRLYHNFIVVQKTFLNLSIKYKIK